MQSFSLTKLTTLIQQKLVQLPLRGSSSNYMNVNFFYLSLVDYITDTGCIFASPETVNSFMLSSLVKDTNPVRPDNLMYFL